ncbi:MAG: hypothetical protein WDZ32_01705 [Candidatus Saccharimonadales bacterium]
MADDLGFNHIEGLDDKISREFHDWVFRLVVSKLKTGFLGEQRTRWALVKVWQDVKNIGTPGEVTGLLGEKEATELFQDICDYYRHDPRGLDLVIEVADSRQAQENIEDMFNQR